MMQMLVDACPSFASRFAVGVASDYLDDGGDVLDYIALGDLARHILDLISAGKLDELPRTFAVVERLDVEGEHYVREAATVGRLESLQNHAEHRRLEKSSITVWLGPQSRRWWDRLNNFWADDAKALRKTD
jgi:hypothetical protein